MPRMKPALGLAAILALSSLACGPSSSDTATAAASGSGGSAATSGSGGSGSTTASTSTSSGMPECPVGKLCLDPPAAGFQLQSNGGAIEAGQDVEYCEVVALPGTADETYYVSAFEVAMTQFSHHLIVAAALPGSDTEKAITAGMKSECTGADVFGGDLQGVTGSQHPYHEERYPDGVGKVFHGGQKLIFDYHYFNSSNAPIKAGAAINFHTVDAAKVTREAHSFGFYNLNFAVPPNSKQSFTSECRFNQDVIVSKLTRHTHQWGKEFSVEYAGGAKDKDHIWTTPNYEETEHFFKEPILVKDGEGFNFTCAFDNTTPKTLKFGLKASDEMCILFGTWYTPTVGGPEANQDCLAK